MQLDINSVNEKQRSFFKNVSGCLRLSNFINTILDKEMFGEFSAKA